MLYRKFKLRAYIYFRYQVSFQSIYPVRLFVTRIYYLSVFEVNITSLRWFDGNVDYKYVVNKVYKVRNIELSTRENMVVRR